MTRNQKHFVGYTVLTVLSVMAVYMLIQYGSFYFNDPAIRAGAARMTPLHEKANPLFLVLCSLTIIIAVSRVMGAAFRLIGQPRVMGEVVGGILLGPSFLSSVAPEFMNAVLPPTAQPFLGIIAQIGVLLYMFVIGLELDLTVLRKTGQTALAISHASIVLPCLMGVGLAFFIFQAYAPLGISFSSFALFMGVSMSITAFPVLARILSDQGLTKTPLGVMALTCAAVDDATAWCLLAVVVGILQSTVSAAMSTVALTILYVLLMLFVVKPVFAKLVPWLERSGENISESSMAVILLCLLVSALATEIIGVHALFGAFLLGAVIPARSRVAEDLNSRLQDLVRVFFLPAFFAYTGMRTEIGLLQTSSEWLVCGAITLVAIAGKFGGAYLAARLSGLSNRHSAALGALMNTRGLVQLIVLNVGLDLGVLTPRLFAMLVVMALITTLLTGPALKLLKITPRTANF